MSSCKSSDCWTNHHYRRDVYIVVGDWYREQEPIYETRSGMQDPIRINLFLHKINK